MKRPALFSALFFLCLSALAQLSPTNNIVITLAGTGTGGFNGENIPATSAQVSIQVDDIIYDNSGNLFIADLQNYRVRKIDAQSGLISTVAGNGVGTYGGDGGLATSAGIQPLGLALDGNGLLYICDWNRIRVVNLNTGIINTLAGTGNGSFNGDNIPAGSANINPFNLVIDSSGDVIFADRANARIRKIDIGTGIVSTIAGDGTGATTGDGGPANLAQFQYPSLIRLDNAGNMYVSGDFSNRVRKIDVSTGIVTTVAGNGVSDYTGDGGLATNASIKDIEGFITDNNGNIYIGSMLGRRLRKVDANSGIISTIAGTGNYGFNGDGIDAITANVMPKALAFDLVGNLTLVDAGSHRIRQLQPAAPATFTIPDPNFSAFLNATYPSIMSGNELDIAGAATITGTMDCNNQNISDLSGIEYFTSIARLICYQNNLTTLDISTLDLNFLSAHSNQLTSISGLAANSNMVELWIEVNQLTDISGIATMNQLFHLSANGNQLTSIPALSNFPALVECSIGSNPVPAGILDVSQNPVLGSLHCGSMNLTGITGLANTQLTFLDCRLNTIADLSDLQNVPTMKTIWAFSNQLNSFPPLSSFPDLEWIQLSSNPLTPGNIDVSSNSQLKYFQCSSNNLTSVTGLTNTTQLIQFTAQNNQLTDVSDLQSISTLEQVFIANNQLTSFPLLSAASNLKELAIQENPFVNWTLDLTSNPQLFRLVAQNSNIDAILAFSNLPNLTNVSVWGNNLQSISGIENATGLVELIIDRNNIEELPDLSGIASLTTARVYDNRLTFEDIEPNVGIQYFTYSPQALFGTFQNVEASIGAMVVLSQPVGGANNIYQWRKDGLDITGANSATYTIASFSVADVGEYELVVTNSQATALTLTSEKITVDEVPTFYIPDPNFRAFLQTTYPTIMDGDNLIISEAALVTGFMDCGNQNISDLSGIEYFTGITELICWNNNLTTLDISTLNLNHLRARNNNLTTVTGLANQTNMQYLWLGNNELTDVSDIAGMSQLWHLSINKNQLTDFPSLDNFPGLVECSVGGNPIPPGVLDVSGNPAMRSLECADMNLTGISGLPNTDLTYLNCGSNSITDLSDLQSLTNMKTIWAGSNQLSGFPSLSSWPNLVDLQVSNNPLPAGLMDVSGNPDLIIFRAQNTNLTGVTGLQNTIQLKRFEANINQLTDVSDLQSISTLERVFVANNQLTTFPTLSLASNLKELSVQGNSYANWNLDLSPNPQLVKLSAQISNIDAIIGLSNAVDLVELHIEGNNLTDLPDMSNQNSLTKSRIHGNKLDFSDAREIRILNSLPSLTSFIYHDQQDFEAVDELSSCLGELLEVSIQAQDSATSYQWYKDGVPISGATASTYTIASFSASDVGVYSCRSYGSALDYPPMNFGPGITYFQSEPINVVESQTGCSFTIPDPNFSAFLNAEYPSIMNGNELDIAGAALVTGFMDCGYQNISDLSGIEYFTGLTVLYCWGNNLTTLDISTLDLQHLRARSNNLTSVTGLANQVNMQYLWLGGNELTDVSDIAGLSQLKHLSINGNQLTNFPPLSNFPDLIECNVGFNPVPAGVLDVSQNPVLTGLACASMNLTGISGLPNTQLTYLDCRVNSITDLSDLQSLSGMKTIWAHTNQLTSFPDLSYFPSLVDLILSTNPLIPGPMDVSGNPDLVFFRVSSANLTAVTGLSNTTQLKRFEAQVNQLTDVSDLQLISTLEQVLVGNNQLSSFPTLSSAANLTDLYIYNNPLPNWELDLTSNPNLKHLHVYETNLDSIIGLSGLTNLVRVRAQTNNIRHINGVENALSITELNLGTNQLVDLPDLSAQASLTAIVVEKNRLDFSDARALRIIDNLPGIATFHYGNQFPFEAPDSVTALIGQILHLEIAPQDSATSYQWFKDGTSIPGATDYIYELTNFQLSDEGSYQCRSYGDALLYPSPMNSPLGIDHFRSEFITVVAEEDPLLLVDVTSPLNDCGYNIGCNGDLTGTATVSYVGGVAPFSVLWSDGQTAETALNLAAGDYTVTVTDANSTQITGEITITEAIVISVTYDSSAPICEDSFTGAIDVTVTGGCTPYEYSWTGPDGYTASSEDLGLLSPGVYTLDVMDAQGCHSLTDVTIGSLPSPEVQISGGKTVFLGYDPMACADLSAVVSGGSGSSTILWSTGDTDAVITVCPQTTTTYSVTVTDSNGCSNTIEILIPVIDVTCGNNGDKVQICHVPNGDLSKAKTLCVSPSAVQAHLDKGDFLGSCDGTTTIDGYQPFVLDIYANPFLVTTQVQYEVFEEGTISIQVYDNQGFLLETPVSEFSTTGTYQFTFDRSSYSGSTFYLVANYQGHETISNTYTLLGL